MTKYLISYSMTTEILPSPQVFAVIRDNFNPTEKV